MKGRIVVTSAHVHPASMVETLAELRGAPEVVSVQTFDAQREPYVLVCVARYEVTDAGRAALRAYEGRGAA